MGQRPSRPAAPAQVGSRLPSARPRDGLALTLQSEWGVSMTAQASAGAWLRRAASGGPIVCADLLQPIGQIEVAGEPDDQPAPYLEEGACRQPIGLPAG